MKRKRFLKLLGIGVILTVLVSVFLPVSPAFAAAGISIDPDEGRIGDEVEVEGVDFDPISSDAPVEYRYVDIYFTAKTTTGAAPSTSSDIDDEIRTYELLESGVDADIDGEFTFSFDVPDRLRDGSVDADVRGGSYYVCVTYEDDDRVRARAEFTVIAGEITEFDPDSGPVGTEVTLSGEDFAENETLTIMFDGSEMDIISGDDETDSSGDFDDATFIIPLSTAGEYTISVSDESLTQEALLEGSDEPPVFTVESSLDVSPVTGPPDDTATVSGTGFGDRADVEIMLDDVLVATATTDNKGSFSVIFTVPDISEGIYDLVAIDEDDNEAETQFTVEVGTEIMVSPVTSAGAPGYVGQNVTISGVAFVPNSSVTITYTSTPVVVGTTTTNTDGDFSFTFKVPKSQPGAHTISASDGTNSLQLPFYVEANVPPVPQLLLPEAATKAPATASFDWSDVTDASGVTYILQVAISQDFAASSLVLKKEGLTISEYTLSKEESLPSRSLKEPYYWRVMAVDGAGNEGNWTDASDFSVGFSMPSWAVHVFWGIGVIAGTCIGYYQGKRRG